MKTNNNNYMDDLNNKNNEPQKKLVKISVFLTN